MTRDEIIQDLGRVAFEAAYKAPLTEPCEEAQARAVLTRLAEIAEAEGVKGTKREIGYPMVAGGIAHEMRGLAPDVWATLHDASPCWIKEIAGGGDE